MSHVSSHHPSRPRLHKKQSNSIIRRRFTLALCLLAVVMLPLALHLRAAGAQSVDPADAFSAKADKLLQRVYHIAKVDSGTAKTESRTQAAREQLLDEPLIGELGQLSQIVSLEPLASGDVKVDLTVRLAADADESELRAAGFATGARIGNIVTVEAPADRLPELAALSSVRKMQAGVYRYPLNDRARRDVGIDNASGQRIVGQTGRGVVVGIIDTGIDFRHGDFRNADGSTRIKALLDISDVRDDYAVPNPLPGSSVKRGHAYTQADINAALAGDVNAVLEKDLNGHGTHVAGTAAGNGLGGTAPGTYAGMAPEADLVIVKGMRSTTASGGFSTPDTVAALQFIQQQAAALNEPFVINMSLGGQLGPHDGTGADEIAIDNLVNGGPGRAVCVAAGNEGGDNIHASATVPAGGSLTLNFNLVSSDKQEQYIDLYNRNFNTYNVTVTRPDGTAAFSNVPFVSNGKPASDSNQLLQLYNSTDSQNGQPDIFLIFKANAPAGNWTITLQDADTSANGAFDAWTSGVHNTNFTSNVDDSHLIASPGVARGAITVGAYVTRSASQTIGNYAFFTSPGPTADGRQKPEISAPGYYLYSSRSADNAQANYYTYGSGDNATLDNVHYGGLAGTSMATPVTTGSVALLLQLNRSLSNDQIKSLLTSNASHDGFDPAGWNPRFGFGKLNIAAALNAAGGAPAPTPTPTPTPVPTPTPAPTPAPAQITLGNLAQTYDGNQKSVTAVTAPSGLNVVLSYSQNNQPVTAPFDAGSYNVLATINDPNYQGSATGILVISKATPTVNITGGTFTYDGNPHPAATGIVLGVNSESLGVPTLTYNGSSIGPVDAGTYNVTGSFAGNSNYTAASTTVTLIINKATPTVNITGGTFTYNGQTHPATGVVTGINSENLGTPTFTYNGVSTVPVNAGTYNVTGSFAGNANYNAASSTGTLIINKATPIVAITGGSFTYDAQTHPASGAVTGINGENLGAPTFTYNGVSTVPVNAGTYNVTGSFAGNTNYTAASPVSAQVVITKAAATLAFGNLSYTFDGTSKIAAVTTTPANLTGVNVTYNGLATAPTNAGSYAVVATLSNSNYQATSISSTLTITNPIVTPTPTPVVKNLQFSATNYTASEGDGFATITVTRTGDTSGAASVDYLTSDDTAHQRSDYTLASGTIFFAAGEVSKTFPVLLIDNAYIDGNRAVSITLSNPNGVSLAGVSTAVLTITDNDSSAPTINPIDTARFFVEQQYADFLGRHSDPGGLDYWSNLITSCNGDQQCLNARRVSVSAAFFIEQEFQLTGNYVYRMYKATYGQRPTYAQFLPDRTRINPDASQIQASKQQFANLFVQRPEFLSRYPSTMAPDAFIELLIATVRTETGGAVDLASQRAALLSTLQTSGRGSVVQQVAENSGFQSAEYNKAFVTMQYFGYLRRDPEDEGFNFWMDVLNNKVANNYRGMVCAFTSSAEYQDRFSSVRTRNDSICGSIGQ